ncbi:MAG: aminodeoxychorismate/anthranilate synthase component II [Planctomycetes bacterium]|nr:aminodeoxychorismate/anthranilate synthase component II [Planctomycetota bacterium]
MLLIIDNYDSFTYNLVQAFGSLGAAVEVRRNDAVTLAGAKRLKPDGLVISPGPGHPAESGVSNALLKHYSTRIPVLGVCLGHQCLGHAFGGRVGRAPQLMHGKTSRIYHDGKGLYRGLSNPFTATRYHSLIVEEKGLPASLEISAHTSDGEIMGLRLRDRPVDGVQFHPESILTEEGVHLLRNYLDTVPGRGA